MATEVRHLADELDRMSLLDWWLLQHLLEDCVRTLDQAIKVRPLAGSPPLSAAVDKEPPILGGDASDSV